MAFLAVEHLNYGAYSDFSIVFPNHSITLIAGINNSGKTLLTKLLAGIIKTEQTIRLNRTFIENIPSTVYREKIKVVFDNYVFKTKKVEDELNYSLENLYQDKSVIDSIYKDIINRFKLTKILKEDPNNLSKYLKIKLTLALSLLGRAEVVIIDDVFKYLDKTNQKELASIINYYQQEDITFIIMITNLEVSLCFLKNRLCVISDGKIVLDKAPLDVLENDSILNKLGFTLPFMVDLSVKLKYYNLVDKVYLDKEGLVSNLWK